MGDMADLAIDQGMDDLLSGKYDEDEDWAYDGGFDICYRTSRTPRTCRQCRTTGLCWGRHEEKWRLFDSAGNLHVCSTPSAREAFK